MSATYSGRIHDPNHARNEYDIYFNDQLINAGVPAMDEFTGLITRKGTEVNIPDGVTEIGASACRGMSDLTKVVIPDGVTTIGTYAFAVCTSLEEIYIPASVTSMGSNVFTSAYAQIKIKCGFSSGDVAGAPWGAPSGATVTYDEDRPEGL